MSNVTAQRVLIVGSDEISSALIQDLCVDFANEIEVCSAPAEAAGYACNKDWDLIIISTSGQETFSLNTCEQIRTKKPTSQIIIVAETSDFEFVNQYLYRGADDYIAIPEKTGEFLARATTAVRRHRQIRTLSKLQDQQSNSKPLNPIPSQSNSEKSDYNYVGDIRFCALKREVSVSNNVLNLTRTEYMLLKYLVDRIDRPCSSVELLNNVLGYTDDNYLPSLHSHVSRLRRKLKVSEKTSIETLWCYGYRVSTTADSP